MTGIGVTIEETPVLEAAKGIEIFLSGIRRVDTYCLEEEGSITEETFGTEGKVTFLGTGVIEIIYRILSSTMIQCKCISDMLKESVL